MGDEQCNLSLLLAFAECFPQGVALGYVIMPRWGGRCILFVNFLKDALQIKSRNLASLTANY